MTMRGDNNLAAGLAVLAVPLAISLMGWYLIYLGIRWALG